MTAAALARRNAFLGLRVPAAQIPVYLYVVTARNSYGEAVMTIWSWAPSASAALDAFRSDELYAAYAEGVVTAVREPGELARLEKALKA